MSMFVLVFVPTRVSISTPVSTYLHNQYLSCSIYLCCSAHEHVYSNPLGTPFAINPAPAYESLERNYLIVSLRILVNAVPGKLFFRIISRVSKVLILARMVFARTTLHHWHRRLHSDKFFLLVRSTSSSAYRRHFPALLFPMAASSNEFLPDEEPRHSEHAPAKHACGAFLDRVLDGLSAAAAAASLLMASDWGSI